jgi:uncharacterized membrane protein YbaN (DUF454 family)
MKNGAKQTFVVIFALVIITIGVLGLMLPLLPGIALLILGLLLLSMYNPKVESWLNKLTYKYPPARAFADTMKKFIERIIGRP